MKWRKGRINNAALRNSSINCIFLRTLLIQDYSKLSITKKRQNKTKYEILGEEDLTLWRRPVCKTLWKALEISSAKTNSSKSIKNPSNSIRYNCHKIYSWMRWPETILEIRNKVTFLEVIKKPIIYTFFKDSTNQRRGTNTGLVYCCIYLSYILKYWDHRWDLPTIWIFQIHKIICEFWNPFCNFCSKLTFY